MTKCDKCKNEVEATWRVTGMCRLCAAEVRGVSLDELDNSPIEEPQPRRQAREILGINPFSTKPGPRQWWFEGLIRHNTTGSTIVLLHSKEKTGKSWLCYQMALATAMGTDFMGYQASPNVTKTLILSPEGGSSLVSERLWALTDPLELSEQQLKDIGSRITLADLDNRVIDLTNENDFLDLADMVNKYESDIIILDPMIEFAGGGIDENNNIELAAFISKLRKLGERKIIVLSHHNKKGGNEARGASSILGKYDFRIGLEKKDNDYNVLQMRIDFTSRNSKTPPMKTCTIEIKPADGCKNYDSALIAFSDYTMTESDHESEILDYLDASEEGVTATDLFKAIGGNTDNKNAIRDKLVKEGKVIMEKCGKIKKYKKAPEQ